jgi:hypothetical protein
MTTKTVQISQGTTVELKKRKVNIELKAKLKRLVVSVPKRKDKSFYATVQERLAKNGITRTINQIKNAVHADIWDDEVANEIISYAEETKNQQAQTVERLDQAINTPDPTVERGPTERGPLQP